MRYQWRLLHHLLRSRPCIPNHSSSSIFRRFTVNSSFPLNPSFRRFSSEPVIDHSDNDHVLLADIFSKPINSDDVKNLVDSNRISITHDAVLAVLLKLDSDVDATWRFSQWVSKNYPEQVSSKCYNKMLCVLGNKGLVHEFWKLVYLMKKKGYGDSKGVKERVVECFEKGGMNGDVAKSKGLFDNSNEKKCAIVCRIVRNNVWSGDVERQIKDLSVGFSGDMIKIVLEGLASEPAKAVIFFRWLEECGMFKHNEGTYNAMARVLGREDSIDRFWKLVGEMRSAGFEMEVETFAKVFWRFWKKRTVKDAVGLYELAMAGANKPWVPCCLFLLRKVAAGKELNMDLFSRVLKAFIGSGNELTDSMVGAVLKSMTRVGRTGEWNKVLKEMEDCGFVAGSKLRSKIAFTLSAAGYLEQAHEFVDRVEGTGDYEDCQTWESLIEGHFVAGNIDKAFDSYKDMHEKKGGIRAANAKTSLVKVKISYVAMKSLCQTKSTIDACKIISRLLNEKVRPWQSIYKLLVTKVLVQGGFADALPILGLMRTHGFPYLTDPFIEYLLKSGRYDSVAPIEYLLKSNRYLECNLRLFRTPRYDNVIRKPRLISTEQIPSTRAFLRVLKALLKQGWHEEAHDLVSYSPRHIRYDADVLNVFYSMKSKEAMKITLFEPRQ
ncbi:hypothetical protein PHAVU_007G278400 [Phaseolus vulgaris]|uniref:Pentacotripeptide-repeat region of PRORP domain-containing protein n=1 Tax=Phaseolus vulgaris TaxID=3885 RepID=V7BIW4_PHAVU|nr:hypothetical protein PHAVU_007G278400g [Phaseolus vulgaris]ESW17909.1 hypothetical protein PHAVU_007G278400g [Phaseolus vulgaris]